MSVAVVSFFCPACMDVYHVCDWCLQRGYHSPWNWNSRWLGATKWVLGTELGC